MDEVRDTGGDQVTARAERIEEAARALRLVLDRHVASLAGQYADLDLAVDAFRAALDLAPPAPGAVVAWAVVDANGRVLVSRDEADLTLDRADADLSARCANECWMNEDSGDDREAWTARKPFRVVPLVRGEA